MGSYYVYFSLFLSPSDVSFLGSGSPKKILSVVLSLLFLTAKIHSFFGNYSFLAICCMQQTGWTSPTWDRLQVSQEQP